MRHYTIEEVMATPGYCRDRYEMEIQKLETKVKLRGEMYKQAFEKAQKLEVQLKDLDILLHPQLRNSRFDFNARYIRFDEAQQIPEFKAIIEALAMAKNFEPYKVGNFIFYRRGTGGLYLYVVPECDFKVPRERKHHKSVSPKKTGEDKNE
jgi:hypothetical protein